ncbi:MAG: Gfo/Idh/MocA family oxidoreductase, partial [Acidobacteriota bacterium]
MQSSTPLRGALIGCGFFGQIQLEAWRRMEGVSIVAACDVALDRAAASAPHAYTDPVEMLDREQLDFIDIATRPDTHADLIRLAVARKTPAICQKPLAVSLEEGIDLARLVSGSGVPVMVHENWRWQPWFRETKSLIDSGAIGAPIGYQFCVRQGDGMGPHPYPNQPYFAKMPRLLIYETLIHFVDTARFLFGDIVSVQAHIRRLNPLIAGEDRALLILTHESSADGVIDGHRFRDPEPPGPAMANTFLEGETGSMRVLATGEILLNGNSVYKPGPLIGYKGDSVRATQEHFLDH